MIIPGILGYQADSAASGMDLLESLRLNFMDVQMPELDELEAARLSPLSPSASDCFAKRCRRDN
jgi:CheY-like chemotaxis protein